MKQSQTEVPIYELGSPDPVRFVYSAISSTDIKVSFELTDGSKITIAEVQSVTVAIDHLSKDKGSAIVKVILFDRDPIAELGSDIKNILLKAATEKGPIANCILEGVTKVNSNWEVNIDSTINEIIYNFEVNKVHPWKKA